jgi:AcrR family transcriptional regulator
VTLFRLFGSKDALLGEAIRTRVYEREVSQLPEIPGDARAELIAWASVEYGNILAHRPSIRQGMTELIERPELRRCMAQGPLGGYSRLQRYLTTLAHTGRCAKDANPVTAAAMLLGALFADAMGRDMMPEALPPAKQVPAAYVDLMLAAIGYHAEQATPRRRPSTSRAKRSA